MSGLATNVHDVCVHGNVATVPVVVPAASWIKQQISSDELKDHARQ